MLENERGIYMKMALCLAGGGIKGAAHIGALKAFEEKNISFDCLSGTSSGSIVATLSAVGYHADDIYGLFRKYANRMHYIDFGAVIGIIKRLFLERKFVVEGLNSGRIIEKIINEACYQKGVNNIRQIKKKLLIPSVDLESGAIYFFSSVDSRGTFSDEVVHINDIDIGKAVRASCSYPGVFCPCRYNNRKLIDGGIRENVPWREWSRIGVDKIICIGFETIKKDKKDKNMVDIISNSFEILCHELSTYELAGVKHMWIIKTKDVSLLDVKEMDYLYQMGYEQTKEYIAKLE